jgi:hypothetical protein
MEAEYLRATVGEALAAGMAQTAMTNPADPVEHLANWLTKYCDNIEDAKRQKNIYAAHQAEEEAALAKVEEDKRKAEVALSLQAAMEAEIENINTICDTETTATALWKSVLEYLKVKTGATATYCGYQIEETAMQAVDGEEQEVKSEVIKYMAASSNNQFMTEKTLRLKGSGKKAKGQLTLGIFEEVDDIPPAPAEGEEGYEGYEPPPEPEGGWPKKWKTPCLVVDQCLQEPKMQYFRIPKLGSYLAVPFRFQYEEDQEAEEKPAIEDGKCPPWPEFTTTTKTQLGVLAMDTLGTEREFRSDVEQPLVIEWASKLAAGLARVSAADIATAREKRAEYKQNNLSHWEDIKSARAKLAEELPGLLEASAAEWLASNTPEEAEAAAEEAELAAEAAAEEGEPAAEDAAAASVPTESDLDKRLREGTVKLNATNATMTELAECVATIADRTDAPCKHWQVLQSLCRFAAPTPQASSTWEECQTQCKDLVEKLVAPETAHRLKKARTCLMAETAQAVKVVIEGADVSELERTHAPISLLLDWGKAMIETSEAALAIRQAAKAVADEKGDEFTEQVEDTVTDKPADEAPLAEE